MRGSEERNGTFRWRMNRWKNTVEQMNDTQRRLLEQGGRLICKQVHEGNIQMTCAWFNHGVYFVTTSSL